MTQQPHAGKKNEPGASQKTRVCVTRNAGHAVATTRSRCESEKEESGARAAAVRPALEKLIADRGDRFSVGHLLLRGQSLRRQLYGPGPLDHRSDSRRWRSDCCRPSRPGAGALEQHASQTELAQDASLCQSLGRRCAAQSSCSTCSEAIPPACARTFRASATPPRRILHVEQAARLAPSPTNLQSRASLPRVPAGPRAARDPHFPNPRPLVRRPPEEFAQNFPPAAAPMAAVPRRPGDGTRGSSEKAALQSLLRSIRPESAEILFSNLRRSSTAKVQTTREKRWKTSAGTPTADGRSPWENLPDF